MSSCVKLLPTDVEFYLQYRKIPGKKKSLKDHSVGLFTVSVRITVAFMQITYGIIATPYNFAP